MIREMHEIIICGEKYKIGDIKRSDFLLLYTNYEIAIQNIFLEFNDTIPQINERQSNELLNFLTQVMKERELHNKPKKEVKEKTLKELVNQFVIMEGQLMHHLHQSLSELRSRRLNYLMKVYGSLPTILGHSEKNDKLDKKSLKKYLGDSYESKSNG